MLIMFIISILSGLQRSLRGGGGYSSSYLLSSITMLATIPSGRSFKLTKSVSKYNSKIQSLKAKKEEEILMAEEAVMGNVSEDFRNMVKAFKKSKAPKKLYEEVIKMSGAQQLDRNMTVYAFRNLQRMDRNDLALELVPLWTSLLTNGSEFTTNDMVLALPLLKSCCKEKQMGMALSIAACFQVTPEYNSAETPLPPLVVEAKKILLPELAHGYVSNKAFGKCIGIMQHMEKASVPMSLETSKHILKSFLRGESSRQIRNALRLITALGVNTYADVDFIQILCSNYLRSLEFVKGAVSIDTLPPEKGPEVCFIGRSNVGKSSLINMLTNTKKLAFTSKTPGKTSEFNYFDAEGVVGPDKEKHNFFLVDVPGVGYAEVNKFLRSTWLDLLQDYTRSRGTLRLICHLVDSRHGLLKADEQCLALIDSIPSSVQYVIVLTKSDKRGGEGRLHIVNEVRAKVLEYTRRDVAVILSSSDTREGGTKIWSTMLDAFAGDHIVVDAVNSN